MIAVRYPYDLCLPELIVMLKALLCSLPTANRTPKSAYRDMKIQPMYVILLSHNSKNKNRKILQHSGQPTAYMISNDVIQLW